jgi:hypothetical protein
MPLMMKISPRTPRHRVRLSAPAARHIELNIEAWEAQEIVVSQATKKSLTTMNYFKNSSQERFLP